MFHHFRCHVSYVFCPHSQSRLKYTFAKDQMYSKMGYPNYVFFVMYVIGILSIIFKSTFHLPVVDFKQQCSINPITFQYQFEESEVEQNRSTSMAFGILIYMFFSSIWDISTLLLYVFKTLSLRRKIGNVQDADKRIMAVLKKILILTLFYEIIYAISSLVMVMNFMLFDGENDIFRIMTSFGYMFQPTAVNISMYLMQNHNQKEYDKFLRIIRRYKLKWCCCGLTEIDVKSKNEFKLEKSEKETTTNTEDLYTKPNQSTTINIDTNMNINGNSVTAANTANNMNKELDIKPETNVKTDRNGSKELRQSVNPITNVLNV